MDKVTVMFSMPSETLDALQARAARDGVAPGSILRTALSQALKSKGNDPVVVRALTTLIARDIEAATSWGDLQHRLGNRGFALRTKGATLLIVGKDTGEVMANSTEIGASYGALIRRFDGPLPDLDTAKDPSVAQHSP